MNKENRESIYITVNGVQYIKTDALNAGKKATVKLKEYVDTLDIKKATTTEIELLLAIAKKI